LFKEAIWLRRGLFGFLGLTLVIFSIMTIDRNRVWQNEVLIWEDLYSKLSPKFPLGHFNLGLAYHRRGELEKAEVEFRRALLYSPGVGSHHYLGMIYQSQGKMDQAAEEYRQAIKMGSKSPQVFYNLGKILSDRGELDEAINLLLEAIVLNPDYYEVHLQLAKIYIDRMQSEKAIEELREVVRIEPGDDRSHFQLATLLDERGILQEAKRHYDLFLQTAKGDAMTGAMIVRAKKRLEEIQKIKQP
jgi:Tfp pilus assembly protein PilF